MSGNPPRPGGGDEKDALPGTLQKTRALSTILEALAPLDKPERLQTLVMAVGVCDEGMSALIAAKMGLSKP